MLSFMPLTCFFLQLSEIRGRVTHRENSSIQAKFANLEKQLKDQQEIIIKLQKDSNGRGEKNCIIM